MDNYEYERREQYNHDWIHDTYEGEEEPEMIGCEDCCRDIHYGETYFHKSELIVCPRCYDERIEDGESTRNWTRKVNE